VPLLRTATTGCCLVFLAACAARPRAQVPPSLVEPPQVVSRPASGATEEREVSLAKGWITVKLVIPRQPGGPKPAIVSPIDDEQALLERGIVLVRFHTNWELLRGVKPAAGEAEAGTALQAGEPSREATSPPPAAAVPPRAAVAQSGDAQAPSSAEPGTGPGGATTSDGGNADTRDTRVGAWLLAAPRPGIVGKGYFGLISQDALHSLPQVLDYLETVPEIDADRIAIAGSSTSGFVALEAVAHDRRFAAAVVRVACGDYHEFLRTSSLALNNDPRWLPNGKLVLDRDYEAMLRDIEPIRFSDRFPPRPLLMLNGRDDTAIPFACAERTAQALAGAYIRDRVPDRFRFVAYEGQGHNLGAAAVDETLAWWDRWLVSAPEDP